MEDNRASREEDKSGRFLKVINILILVVLLAMTGLLASMHWRLSRELASLTPPALPIAAAPAPVVEAAAPVQKPQPVSAAVRKPAPAVNYTQPPVETVAPIALPPAPVARVIPTDITPAEPMPFPRSEALPPTRPQRITATIPASTILTVRLLDTLSTDRHQTGDPFRASLEEPIIFDGHVAIPRGATVEGRVVYSEQAGRVSGVSEMTVELNQVRLENGETVVLHTTEITRQGETSTGSDAAKVGIGAAIGAAIGAISGGGKGAAVGAATGAGAGTAGVLLTRGKPLVLGPETVLTFQMNSPVTLTFEPGQSADYTYDAPQPRPRPGDWDARRPVLRRRR